MKVPRSYMGIKKARIEMLPLIDIVFLLLVFFIYAMLSMAVHRSLPVSLPVSDTGQIDTAVDLTVTARLHGDLFLDDEKISLEELQTILRGKVQKAYDNKELQVDLFADRALSYQELYRILDAIRNAGITNVSLQADSNK